MKKLILLLLLILCSCSVKKNKSSIDEKTKVTAIETSDEKTKVTTNESANIKTLVTSETNEQSGEVVETQTDEPIDNSKPAEVVNSDGTKTILNNAKITKTKRSVLSDRKNKVISNIEETKKSSQIEDKQAVRSSKVNLEATKKERDLEVDKKWQLPWWIWLIIALIIFALGYRSYKKTNPLS